MDDSSKPTAKQDLTSSLTMTSPNASAEKRPHSEGSEGADKDPRGEADSESDDEDELDETEAGKDLKDTEEGKGMDTLTRLRREKRLAMNRESARARRKRKKILIESLEQQVADLTRSNQKFKRENEHLVVRVETLSEKVSEQDKELTLLRSVVGKGQESRLDPRLVQQQKQHQQQAAAAAVAARASHPLVSSNMASSAMLRSSVENRHQNFGLDAATAAADLSLRRLLHAQSLERAMGNQGLASAAASAQGVAPNRGIDQQILSRIDRESSVYDRQLAGFARPGAYPGVAAAAGGALPGPNTVSIIVLVGYDE